MGLTIELSVDIKRDINLTSIKKQLINLAENTTNYFIHEVEGHGSIIDRNICIQIVEFDNLPEMANIINYIRKISQYKYIHIDSIYQDNGRINMIYSSPRYQSINIYNSTKIKPKPKPISLNQIIDLIKILP